jgi:hypothetical protein
MPRLLPGGKGRIVSEVVAGSACGSILRKGALNKSGLLPEMRLCVLTDNVWLRTKKMQ